MTCDNENNDFVVVTQINLNKQPTASTDLALYMKYINKHVSLDGNDNIKGMQVYNTDFKYTFSHEELSADELDSSFDDGHMGTNQFGRHRAPSSGESSSRSSRSSSAGSSSSSRSSISSASSNLQCSDSLHNS